MLQCYAKYLSIPKQSSGESEQKEGEGGSYKGQQGNKGNTKINAKESVPETDSGSWEVIIGWYNDNVGLTLPKDGIKFKTF